MATDFSQFVLPESFFLGGGGGGNIMGDVADILGNVDPVAGFLGGLFGGDEPSFKPYIDPATGNYVWTDPAKRNPVPLASVPGASLKPSKQYKQMAAQIQAITDLLPFYSRSVAGQIIPQMQAELAGQQATSEGFSQLMLDLYKKFGPQLNDVGNQIAKQNAMATAERDRDVLAGPGRDLVLRALETAKLYDPEYFATRELTSSRIGDLLKDIDLGAGLNETERREIESSLAAQGTRRGTYNAPSNLATVENAMTFGQAGNARKQQNRSALSNAIGAATAALPMFKSGTDVFQVATGKASVPNSGENKFAGPTNPTGVFNSNAGLASGMSNNMTQLSLAQMQIDAQKKDWADYLNQVTSSIGDLTSSAGSVAGMFCWIARRVYGSDNPRWLEFRSWMLNKAPNSLRDTYCKRGANIADNMTEADCNYLRPIMDNILGY